MSTNEDSSDREDRVAQMLRQSAVTERAPDELRAKLTADAARAPRGFWVGGARQALGRPAAYADPDAPPRPRRPVSPAARRNRLVSLVALPVIVGVLIIASALAGGSSKMPSVKQVTTLATLSPASAAPGADPAAPKTLLAAQVQGLHFPNWTSYAGWRATGARRDEIQGRPVTTVFYRNAAKQQVAYSIVATPAIYKNARGSGSYVGFHSGGRTYILWTVSDHTCILSGTGITAGQLWHLAQPTTRLT